MLHAGLEIPIRATTLALRAQAPVHKRLEGLRETARQLQDRSSIDQVVPLLLAIGIACLMTVALYGAYRGIAGILARYRTMQSSGLVRPQTAWLLEMAIEADVRPPVRILRSVRTFEQVTTGYLERQLAVADDWPEDARILREVAWRIGTAPDDGPPTIGSTRDIGAPWAVEVSAVSEDDAHEDPSDREHRTDGFVATADVDELVVHAVNDLGQLDGLESGSRVRLHARPDDTFDAPAPESSFECSVVRVRARGRFSILRLAHADAPIDEAVAETHSSADDETS